MLQKILTLTKALSDENRVRALMALGEGELCVCQIIELLSLAPSTVSKHMSILRQARLVESRKEGRWMYYRLTESGESGSGGILAWLRAQLKDDRKITDDAGRLQALRKKSKDELCNCYRG